MIAVLVAHDVFFGFCGLNQNVSNYVASHSWNCQDQQRLSLIFLFQHSIEPAGVLCAIYTQTFCLPWTCRPCNVLASQEQAHSYPFLRQ